MVGVDAIFRVAAAPSPDVTVSLGIAAPALGLLVVAIAFNMANQRTQRREIRALKRENVLCNYRQLLLYETLAMNGLRPPEHFWTAPPEGVAEMNIAEHEARERGSREKRRGRFDLFSQDEDGRVDVTYMIVIVALILLATVVVGGVLNRYVVDPLDDLGHRLDRVEAQQRVEAESDRRESCVASLTADFFGAIGNAVLLSRTEPDLAAALAADVTAATERVRNRVEICADGTPDEFVPEIPPPAS